MFASPITSCWELRLPSWVSQWLEAERERGVRLDSPTQRMQLALRLAKRHILEKTGGPFAALVFDPDAGEIVSVGVNLVTTEACAVLHAEVVATMLASKAKKHHSLRGLELVTTTAPCAMCLGTVPWAGFSRLVCGAREEDASAIGFDEGDKPEPWVESLRRRGVVVEQDVCRGEAVEVLQAYKASGAIIY